MRPICKNCKKNPAAINYCKNNKTYYRSQCESCTRYGGQGRGTPRWEQVGYRKKNQCEKCGYKSNHTEQFDVYHIDGDLTNCRPSNLKTICANCQRILQKEGVKWKQGDLIPDF
jgi:hypothetical protein